MIDGVHACLECGQEFGAYWLLRVHQQYHSNPRSHPARVELSVEEMAKLIDLKYSCREWLERYG